MAITRVVKEYCPFCESEYGTRALLMKTERGKRCSVHGEIIDVRNIPMSLQTTRETPIENGKPKKFYAGAKHIGNAIEKGYNATCTRDTFEQAVEDAREYMMRDESLNTVVIVEIVAVIRREKPVVNIEKFIRAEETK
jgi:hypothetical protein